MGCGNVPGTAVVPNPRVSVGKTVKLSGTGTWSATLLTGGKFDDAWGGGDWNLANYTGNMQAIIDSAKARGMEPILARVIAGPDLDAWFRAHPEELNSDCVHPSATAAQSIQRLWAEAMTKNLYSTSTSIAPLRRLPAQHRTNGSDALGRPRTGTATGIQLDGNGGTVKIRKP